MHISITHPDLSLRDIFALTARDEDVNSLIGETRDSAAAFLGIKPEDYNPTTDFPKCVAKARYLIADAMRLKRVTA
jgi:hypothetical protein